MKNFNPAAFFILLREVLEMSIIVGIMLAYCRKTGFLHLRKWVWIGTLTGVFGAICVGGAFGGVYHSKGKDLFSGRTSDIFSGSIMTAACLLLSWMVLWSKATGADLNRMIEQQMTVALEKGANWRIGLIPFLQVFREGVEIVIFLTGIGVGESWVAIVAPSIVGAIVGIIAGFLLLRGIMKVRIDIFFHVTSLVLLGFASGLLSNGFGRWSDAGFFGRTKSTWGYELSPEQRRWTTQPLWSTYGISNKSNFFDIFAVLFGYNSRPTFITIICYALYWLVALSILQLMSQRAGKVTQGRVNSWKSWMRIESGLSLFWYFLTFIWACVVSQHPYPAFMISIIGSISHICSILAISQSTSLRDRTKKIASIVAFWSWIWISLFTYIFILFQLHCAGKNLCGTFGTDYYYVFFIFSRSYNTGPRLHDSWRTGAVLTMALVFHLFHGFFHALVSYYVMREKCAPGTPAAKAIGKAGPKTSSDSSSSDEVAKEKTVVNAAALH